MAYLYRVKPFCLLVVIGLVPLVVTSQCEDPASSVLSSRTANYTIDIVLDTEEKKITGKESIQWINPSPDTIRELRLYMYLNAFKNTESTYLLEAEAGIFSAGLHDWTDEKWGYVDITSAIQEGEHDLTNNQVYIQPDDNNATDESVLLLKLAEPVLPFDTLDLTMEFVSKLPHLISRVGYSRDDFYHVVHWFPQLGVYEQDVEGNWAWNCHQFHRRTEFYSDFGNYSVSMEVPDHLMIEATGCQVGEEETRTGWKRISFEAFDVIDFAWVAFPYFHRLEDNWNGIDIIILTPYEHDILVPRFLEALKACLAYMEEYVGPYPYPSITLMDPPIHALESGFMEYPTYITLGSFRFFPKGLRTIESLVMHEFIHQYFMAVVATNEKEEAWLDEGFVTYYEDRIMEATYGEGKSMVDIYGFNVGNSEFTRYEYSRLPDPSIGPCARPGWEIQDYYKGIIYSKTATVLKTMEGLLGIELMDRVMQSYYRKWQFRHPKGKDFIEVVKSVVLASETPEAMGDIDTFFSQLIYGTDVCDYAVESIENRPVRGPAGIFGNPNEHQYKTSEDNHQVRGDIIVRRLGGIVLPVEIQVNFEDGTTELIQWDGRQKLKHFVFEKAVKSCWLDPERKLRMDMDTNNNSLTLDDHPWPINKIGVKTIFWLQNLFQSFSFLV